MFDAVSGAAEATLARAEGSDGLGDADLVRALADLEDLGRRVDAARVALAGEVAHRSRRGLGPERLSARLGCRTPGEAVQRVTGVSGASAGRRIRLGLATRSDVGLTGTPLPARFEDVAHALRSGALGVDAAHAIVTALEPTLRVADPAAVAAGERELVAAAVERWGEGRTDEADDAGDEDVADDEHASEDRADEDGADEDGAGRLRSRALPALDADGVRLQARLWAEVLDPDGAAPTERDEECRFLTLHAPRHGLVPMSGLLLPQVAAALRRYADACTNPRTPAVADPTQAAAASLDRPQTADPTQTASAAAPADPTQAADDAHAETRSRAQVLHDVLATIVGVAARAVDAPSVAGNAPTLVVVTRAEDLAAGDGIAHTDDGVPVSLAVARHVGCAGAVQRVTTDTAGRIVGLWSADRCFTGSQRRAIAARDGGCVIPGCHVPAAWCEVHHVVPHADDPGGTTTDNGVLLCWHHHRTIETSGWRIRMVRGLPLVSPPSWLDPAQPWRPARRGAAPRGAAPRGPDRSSPP